MRPELDVLTLRCSSMEMLHGAAKSQFCTLADNLARAFEEGATKSFFVPFETYRTAQRQNYLFHVHKTTRAKAFQSPHQFGLAVDFVPQVDGAFQWDASHDWDFLKVQAEAVGLRRPLSWDLAHVEHPRWQGVLAAVRF